MFGRKEKIAGVALGLGVACLAVACAPLGVFAFCTCAGSLLACGAVLADMV